MATIAEYIVAVKEQLVCNATDEFKNTCITFEISNEEVDANLDYFTKMKQLHFSPYKALFFFREYLRGELDNL